MPATFVHPLFALPFRRLGLPPVALAVGAMAPDVAYALPGPVFTWAYHDLLGLFAFALPVGLVAWALVQTFIAPAFAAHREAPSVRTIVAVLVGAGTHILIDAFTHPHGWGVGLVPVLGRTVIDLPGGGVEVCSFLQYGSSAAGTVYLVYRFRRLLGALFGTTQARWIAGAVALGACAYGIFGAARFDGVLAMRVLLVRTVASALVLAAFALLVACGTSRLTKRPILVSGPKTGERGT